MKNVLDTHYKRLGKDYDRFLYYSPQFVRALTSKMIDKLQLKPSDVLVDLGCGTAMYSLDILQQIRLHDPIIGVDPYPEMLANIPKGAPIMPVSLDALSFSRLQKTYDKILVKEAIHHIPERDELFSNLYDRLAPGGRLLLVHVPPKVQYPLFKKALKNCENWHANPDELVVQLSNAGFQVERDAVDYRHQIPKEQYFRMVEGCYMSVLTALTKEELEEGLEEMKRIHKDKTILEFVDHFDYLTAIRQ